MRQTGHHYLQIPGPSAVPDRILRAIDMPVIDHRGPEFADLGKRVLAVNPCLKPQARWSSTRHQAQAPGMRRWLTHSAPQSMY